MFDLQPVTVLVFSADAGKCAFVETSLPHLQVGTCFFHKNTALRLESVFYDRETKAFVYLCGCFGGAESGELDGAILYFPYGHVPDEVFESFFTKGESWKVWKEGRLDAILKKPIKIFKSPQFSDSRFTMPN